MIKIAEVCSDTNIGGAGKCLLTLMKELDRERFDPLVILPENSLLEKPIRNTGTRVITVGGIADKSLDISVIRQLEKIFRSEKPDIVHTHASMSARIAAKRCHIKTVYTRHSVFEPPRSISRGVGRALNGLINNSTADAIIAVAEAAKDNLTATGVSEKKITVVLNGVYPCERLSNTEALQKKFGVQDGERVVSIAARLEEVKGHEYFIEAAELVKKRGINACFLIAGTGGLEGELKQKVRQRNLGGTVHFCGFVGNIAELLSITDISVNASWGTEATSLSLLEGMSMGIPAVVSDFGGNPGVIKNGENGLIVPKKDSSALASAIASVLEDDALRGRLSEGARRIFNESFTAAEMTRRTEAVYLNLLNKSEDNAK